LNWITIYIKVKDTHAQGYLHLPDAKPDLSFATNDKVYWTNLVSVGELKENLKGRSRTEAIGQLQDRAFNIFRVQTEREYFVGFIGCATGIELWRFNYNKYSHNIGN
jgi:hypothetical protein